MDSTTRGLLVAFAVLLVVALGLPSLMGGMMGPSFAGQGPLGQGMMRGQWWMWGLGMGLGGLVMLVFWGALIVGLVLLARGVGIGHGPRSTPLEILKRRYAAGQITKDEYDRVRKDLEL